MTPKRMKLFYRDPGSAGCGDATMWDLAMPTFTHQELIDLPGTIQSGHFFSSAIPALPRPACGRPMLSLTAVALFRISATTPSEKSFSATSRITCAAGTLFSRCCETPGT